MSGPIKVRRATPTETDLGVAMNALQDAISEAESDGRRALDDDDEHQAEQHEERAGRLRRVYEWLQEVDLD